MSSAAGKLPDPAILVDVGRLLDAYYDLRPDPGAGLLNPTHHLADCLAYLLGGGREWPTIADVGKTVVTSVIIDRHAAPREPEHDAGLPLFSRPPYEQRVVDIRHFTHRTDAGQLSGGTA